MRPSIVGVAARCAAGDLAGLRAAVHSGRSHLSDVPPYPADGLANPRCGRVPDLPRDRPAEHLLREVVHAALREADLPQGARVGLVVGTSSGNIGGPWERWHRELIDGGDPEAHDIGRDGPTRVVAEELGLHPATTLCVACVSGTAVLGVAEGWLRSGMADAVVAAGVDALCLFVHAGFSGLGALARHTPRPFQPDRDGLVPGEGAAALVLTSQSPAGSIQLLGTAMASDAVGMTAPDREARGATRALNQALHRAHTSPDDVDLVSIHGTGTRYNDAMEGVALDAVFRSRRPAVHGIKHLIGHTMGAAGAIEAALLVDLLRRAEVPPPIAEGLDGTPRFPPEVGLSMSAAFGGLNAVAVFGRGEGDVRPEVSAAHRATVTITEADAWPTAPTRWHRADPYVRAGMLAVARLVEQMGPLPEDTAVVGATQTGCRIVDLAYHERLVREGASQASRRLFTYTLPGAPSCEISIHWGLHGAQLMFMASAEVARDEAARWVRLGHASAAIALWCEAPTADGPVHAHASLWSADAGGALGVK